mmetsp:Transcript_115545/g.201055  ORF Transcript_115545/g.201055 Transcript_115545/m.201055 type:complete len:200 (-) Transcript_115545:94-693(-)
MSTGLRAGEISGSGTAAGLARVGGSLPAASVGGDFLAAAPGGGPGLALGSWGGLAFARSMSVNDRMRPGRPRDRGEGTWRTGGSCGMSTSTCGFSVAGGSTAAASAGSPSGSTAGRGRGEGLAEALRGVLGSSPKENVTFRVSEGSFRLRRSTRLLFRGKAFDELLASSKERTRLRNSLPARAGGDRIGQLRGTGARAD